MEKLHLSIDGKKVGWDLTTPDDLSGWPDKAGRVVIDLHCDVEPRDGLPTIEGIAKVGTIIRVDKGVKYKAYLTLMPTQSGHFLRTYNFVDVSKPKK